MGAGIRTNVRLNIYELRTATWREGEREREKFRVRASEKKESERIEKICAPIGQKSGDGRRKRDGLRENGKTSSEDPDLQWQEIGAVNFALANGSQQIFFPWLSTALVDGNDRRLKREKKRRQSPELLMYLRGPYSSICRFRSISFDKSPELSNGLKPIIVAIPSIQIRNALRRTTLISG